MAHIGRPLLAALCIVTVSCGGGADDPVTEPTRSYEVRLRTDDSEDRYRYVAEEAIDIRVGDEVTFEVANTGTLIHDLQIVAPDGSAIGSAPPAVPGATTSITVLFETAGPYRLNCLVDDHLTQHRMQSVIEVT